MTARKEDEITASIKTTQAALVISSTVDDAVSLNEGSSSLRSLIDSKEKNIIVFYGSQTGTAEEFSNRFVKEINQRTCKVKAVSADLNDLEWRINSKDMSILADRKSSFCFLFLLATYGEGDPTDNAASFVKFLRPADNEDTSFDQHPLSFLKYSVFGLGNRSYEHFNAVGKYVDERLANIGGKRLLPIVLGDDDKNLEDDFQEWKKSIIEVLFKEYHVDDNELDSNIKTTLIQPLKVIEGIFNIEPEFRHYPSKGCNFELLTNPLHDRHVYRLDFDLSESGITYEPGDHVGVFPKNHPDLVSRLSMRLGIANLQQTFTLKMTTENDSVKNEILKPPFPIPTTYQIALSRYLDLNCPVKAHIVETLAELAQDTAEKSQLLLLAKDKDRFLKHVVEERRSLCDILFEFKSIKINAAIAFGLFNKLQTRYYSISSSQKHLQNALSITVVRQEYLTPNENRRILGLASNYMYNNYDALFADIIVRKSTFKLPKFTDRPVIMIGPGTGIAPFIGFLQERKAILQQSTSKLVKFGTCLLFFGCRAPTLDYLYKNALEEFHSLGNNVLTDYFVAFSRSEPEIPKKYVQHLMEDQKDFLSDLIVKKRANVYVCGDAKRMAKDVMATLTNIIVPSTGSEESAIEFIKAMRKNGRYMEDVWS